MYYSTKTKDDFIVFDNTLGYCTLEPGSCHSPQRMRFNLNDLYVLTLESYVRMQCLGWGQGTMEFIESALAMAHPEGEVPKGVNKPTSNQEKTDLFNVYQTS